MRLYEFSIVSCDVPHLCVVLCMYKTAKFCSHCLHSCNNWCHYYTPHAQWCALVARRHEHILVFACITAVTLAVCGRGPGRAVVLTRRVSLSVEWSLIPLAVSGTPVCSFPFRQWSCNLRQLFARHQVKLSLLCPSEVFAQQYYVKVPSAVFLVAISITGDCLRTF